MYHEMKITMLEKKHNSLVGWDAIWETLVKKNFSMKIIKNFWWDNLEKKQI